MTVIKDVPNRETSYRAMDSKNLTLSIVVILVFMSLLCFRSLISRSIKHLFQNVSHRETHFSNYGSASLIPAIM